MCIYGLLKCVAVSKADNFFKEVSVKAANFFLNHTKELYQSCGEKLKNRIKKKKTTICLSVIRQCCCINNTITDRGKNKE